MTTKTKTKTKTETETESPYAAGTYVIARCRDAGVHAGYIVITDEHHTVLRDVRRIWRWSGAASLSEIAVYGLNPLKSEWSKIGCVEKFLRLRDSDICELTVCSDEGRASIEGMPEWRA